MANISDVVLVHFGLSIAQLIDVVGAQGGKRAALSSGGSARGHSCRPPGGGRPGRGTWRRGVLPSELHASCACPAPAASCLHALVGEPRGKAGFAHPTRSFAPRRPYIGHHNTRVSAAGPRPSEARSRTHLSGAGQVPCGASGQRVGAFVGLWLEVLGPHCVPWSRRAPLPAGLEYGAPSQQGSDSFGCIYLPAWGPRRLLGVLGVQPPSGHSSGRAGVGAHPVGEI